MPDMVKVKVLRTQIGDKRYERGDKRELPKAVAEKFAKTGAVEILAAKPAKKAAKKPQNKAAPKPENKSEG